MEENPDDQRGFEEGEKQQAWGLRGEGETPVIFPKQVMDEAVEESKPAKCDESSLDTGGEDEAFLVRPHAVEKSEGKVDQEQTCEVDPEKKDRKQMEKGNDEDDPAPERREKSKRNTELKPDRELIEDFPAPAGKVGEGPREEGFRLSVGMEVGQGPGKSGLSVEIEPPADHLRHSRGGEVNGETEEKRAFWLNPGKGQEKREKENDKIVVDLARGVEEPARGGQAEGQACSHDPFSPPGYPPG